MSHKSAALLVGLALLALHVMASEAFAQKAEFERNKPHANIGTIGHEAKGPTDIQAPTGQDNAQTRMFELLVPVAEESK